MAIVTIEKTNFETEVINEEKPVILEFSAPWCGFCRRLTPVIDMLDKKYGDKVKVTQMNIDDNEELTEKFNVDTIPTLILFKNGQASEPFVNPPSAPAVTGWLKENGVL